ncbi:BRO1 domain-containing protein BROX, partial [Sigmodon hispidus]
PGCPGTCFVDQDGLEEIPPAYLPSFINSVGDSTQESKLRYVQNFKWTDTLQGHVPSTQQDAVFELISMGFNVALWYTKYASRLAGKENITEDEAKEVHRSLKIAAGIFKHLKGSVTPLCQRGHTVPSVTAG